MRLALTLAVVFGLVAIAAGCSSTRAVHQTTLNTNEITGLVAVDTNQPVTASGFIRLYKLTSVTNEENATFVFRATCLIPETCHGTDVVNALHLKLPDGNLYTAPNWTATIAPGQTIKPDIALAYYCASGGAPNSIDFLKYATTAEAAQYGLPASCGAQKVVLLRDGLDADSVQYKATVDSSELP